jgi:hypothetical protein
MKFRAIDLSRMSLEALNFRPDAISSWPTTELDVHQLRGHACIASWKWDVSSPDEWSYRLSECAWDGIQLGFRYLLADIVSLSQNPDNVAQELIEFSGLYESLHAVIAYGVDPDLKRPWLRNEARKILQSPTKLDYIVQKWRLRVPLKPSLIINQICTRRLGLQKINTDKLSLCDTEASSSLSVRDLNLVNESDRSLNINLDRRRQMFASDVLLVYELGLPHQRPALIERLRDMRSNAAAVPAALCVWAMIDGLSISVKGCDWDIPCTIRLAKAALRVAINSLGGRIVLDWDDERHGAKLAGAVEASMNLRQFDFSEIIRRQSDQGGEPRGNTSSDLFVLNSGRPAIGNRKTLETLLEASLRYLQEQVHLKSIGEPEALPPDWLSYDLLFDATPGHNPDGVSVSYGPGYVEVIIKPNEDE